MSAVELLHQLKKIVGKFRRVEGIDIYDTATARFADLPGSIVDPGKWLTILSRAGRGAMDEFQVRSPNTDFKVLITVDGATQLEKTYAELRLLEQNSPSISAFAELDEDGNPTGYYVASIRGVPYYSSILVRVQNTGVAPITFSQLFAKHNARGE